MATKSKDRIIIDTNLWISFLLSRDHSKLDYFFSNDSITIIFSEELLNEFIDVAQRPKFRKYFSMPDLEELLNNLSEKAELVSVKSRVNICHDPKDNFLLSLAVDGKASFLITGDKDLLVLQKIRKSKIITMAEYLKQS